MKKRIPMLSRMILLAALAFGCCMLYWSYAQPVTEAAVTVAGDYTKRHHRTRKHGKSYTVYTTHLTVTLPEEVGGETVEVVYSARDPWSLPREGQRIRITRNLFGKWVAWPDSDARIWGWAVTLGGGMLLLIQWMGRKGSAGQRDPYHPAPEETGQEETERPQDPGTLYSWSVPADREYARDAFRVTMGSAVGMCALITAVMAALLRDAEVLGITLGVSAFVILLAYGLCRLMYGEKAQLTVRYRITRGTLRIGEGRYALLINLRKATGAELRGNRIVLEGVHGNPAVLVPEDQKEEILRILREQAGI